MDELTSVGCAFVFGVVVLLACAGGDAADELDEPDELGSEQLEQAPPPVDCRPVRFEDCGNAWNDRACFTVPAACAVSRGPAPSPEP